MHKNCNKCQKYKKTSEFRKGKGYFGVRGICKECEGNYYRLYYVNNKDTIKKQSSHYKKTNAGLESGKLYFSKRKALKESTCDGTINLKSTNDLLIKELYKCVYCLKDISDRKERHLDHIYPLSKGGKHTIGNVQWLCCKCNLGKGVKLNYNF